MILLALDFETSGLDPLTCVVREVGAVLWSTAQHRQLESAGFLVKSSVPVTAEESAIHHITPAAIDKFGFQTGESLQNIISMLEMADAFLGQNIVRFDHQVLINWAIKENFPSPIVDYIRKKLVIDTLFDIPGVEGKKLQYMLADHGKLNPFPHGGITDALSTIVLIEEHTPEDGNIDPIVNRAKSPTLILQSHQNRSNNADAKKLKFRWQPDFKIWWKAVKEQDLEALRKDAPFDITIRQDLTIDQVWRD
jgi:DNA polymerase III epsilon subunit-like protein